MPRPRVGPTLFAALLITSLPRAALADDPAAPTSVTAPPSPADVKRADDLFRRAVAKKLQNKMAEACPLFAESHAIDPDGAKLVNIAECHEAEGKTGTAWRELLAALKLAKRIEDQEIVTFVRRRLQTIVLKLHQVNVLVPREVAAIPGVEITFDGAPLSPFVPSHFEVVDPGHHTVLARAPGHIDFRKDVMVSTPMKQESVTVTLKKPLPPPDYTRSNTLFAVGIPGVVGAAGLFVGGIAIGDSTRPARDARIGFFTAGGVLGAAGVACLVLGGVFWPPARDPRAAAALRRSPWQSVSVAPVLGPTAAGLSVTGQF